MNDLEFPPQAGEAKKLVVMLHGYGSHGDDLLALAPIMSKRLPDCHFYSPNGIQPCEIGFGYQWFSLQDRSPEVVMSQAEKNSGNVLSVIEAKQKQLGLANSDTILLGFSQGTMISSYLTLSSTEPYYAMIGFSGRLIPPLKSVDINKKTPICLVHGADDEMVLPEESQHFQQYCIQHGIENRLKIIPNLQHSIDASGIEFILDFLNELKR